VAISSGTSAEWWSEPEFEARFPLLPADVLPRMCARIRLVDKHQVQVSGPVYRWSDLLHALQAETHDLDKAGERARAEEIASAMIGMITLGSPPSPPQIPGGGRPTRQRGRWRLSFLGVAPWSEPPQRVASQDSPRKTSDRRVVQITAMGWEDDDQRPSGWTAVRSRAASV